MGVVLISFVFSSRALGMRALDCFERQECTCLKYFEVSVMIVVRGIDIDIVFLANLRNFIEE